MIGSKKLLLEKEAAEILGCSTSKVKRLRLGGKLAYLPGRPVLIDADDLNEYIERVKAQKAEKQQPKKSKREVAVEAMDPMERAWRRAERAWFIHRFMPRVRAGKLK